MKSGLNKGFCGVYWSIYSAPNKSVQKTGGANLRKEFKEINGEFFGAGLEEITQNPLTMLILVNLSSAS